MSYGLLQDKVIVVTGGVSGIGLACAEAYVSEGGRVVIGDIQDEAGIEIAKNLGDSALYCHADVTREADVAGLIDAAVDRYGRLDVMHNNAGATGDQAPLIDITEEGLNSCLDLLTKSVVFGHKYAARQFQQQGTGGSIVTTASIAALAGAWSAAGYTIAKHAVLGIIRQAASEMGKLGIRSNAICPGVTMTAIMAGTFGVPPEQSAEFIDFLSERMADDQPIGRVGRPEDIAGVALFLASDLSAFLTGVIIPVDGGATAVNLGAAREHAIQAGQDFTSRVA
jgi:NAD(P)-dependent dehydrogenase (short-subunit alcohol dehydrogenase family)